MDRILTNVKDIADVRRALMQIDMVLQKLQSDTADSEGSELVGHTAGASANYTGDSVHDALEQLEALL